MRTQAKLTARVASLEARLETLLQLAKVLRVDDAKNLVDIEVRGEPLKGLPYLTGRAGNNGKTYWMPEVGEVGLLLCPAGDVGNALFLPAMFLDVPETDKNVMRRIFSNGVEEKWDGNDDTHVLRVGDTERKTEKAGKIEDTTGTAKLTLLHSGTAKLEASESVQAELTTILANIIGAHLFPSGITTLQSPVGPVMFAPAPSPASAPALPEGSAPDDDGQVTQTPASTISGVSVQTVSTLNFTVPAISVTTPGGAGTTVPTAISVAVTGTLTLQFPARGL